ncbi:uncharacterized protein LOC114416830 isoform X2 [Glycine soja]|uniref:uncharacterized protein LOC114416830 isoform X2 n=1 Tax=Glycine soja TaxID=3848 RepID=UPI00103A1D58|nr:uncharacterized protein LOC114416830 isoform X2 [Glycine soja]
MVELAKESTTMRRVLDPMFVYFDSRQHWAPQKGLAMIILSRMAYFMENSGNQRLILASVIHHLDHKNVMNDPQLKTCVIQVATSLAMQIRSESGLAEIGFVGVLCRHLRKSLQASSEFVGEQELNLNISLQNSIDDCLLEIANGVIDAQPLFDLMAINLENIPSGVVGRATIGSLIILARAVTLALSHLHSQQGFPEALLVQLLKVMLHSDEEARVGAHLIFSILLFPSSFHTNEISSLRSRYLGQHNKRHSHAPSVSASASITALLEKLRRNRNTKAENHVNIVHDQERDIVAEDWKQGCGLKNSPNFYKLTSIIDKATGSPSLTDTEPYVMKLTEDQMAQLLSAFWIQANLPDNLPSNIEAVAHSFILTLIVLRIKVSSSRITGSVGVKKASKGDTIFFYNARNSPGQYDLSRINHLHSSFVPEDVPDAASEKDLGNEFFKQKKFKEARDCYSRSIALSPTAVAYANRAMANIKLRRFQEAEDDCTEALNLDDRYIKAYSRRATARKELGKIKESMDDAEFALRLEPNNQEIKKQYADAKSFYEKDILQKASGVLRSTVQGTQKVGKSEEKVNGDSIHPISRSTQKSGLAEVHHHKKSTLKFGYVFERIMNGKYLLKNHS